LRYALTWLICNAERGIDVPKQIDLGRGRNSLELVS
jgi:hypothetical protein